MQILQDCGQTRPSHEVTISQCKHQTHQNTPEFCFLICKDLSPESWMERNAESRVIWDESVGASGHPILARPLRPPWTSASPSVKWGY